jgi:hypothetical protein
VNGGNLSTGWGFGSEVLNSGSVSWKKERGKIEGLCGMEAQQWENVGAIKERKGWGRLSDEKRGRGSREWGVSLGRTTACPLLPRLQEWRAESRSYKTYPRFQHPPLG